MPKDDYGASHWSSDKVWERRKKSIKMISHEVPTDPAFWRQRVTLNLDALTLLAIHGSLCLALRHPQNKGESRHIVVSFVKQIGQHMVNLGILSSEQLRQIERIEAEEGSPDLG